MTSTAIVILAFIVIGLPVGLGIWSDLYKRRLAHEERKLELMSGELAKNSVAQAAHAREMEQRLRVLEQIVTDRGVETASQIEALRDKASTKIEKQVP